MSIQYELSDIKFSRAGMNHLRQDRDGEVGRDLYRRGLRLQALAKASAPIESGRLKESIYLRYSKGASNPSIIVGSELNYAYYVHEGVRPHQIMPDQPGRMLRFQVNGRIVYATKVNHPGQAPQRYLTRHLRSIVK